MIPDYFMHESSYVDEGAQIGAGTKIWHFCHVMGSAKIGERCNIGQNVFVAADVTIGNNVKIQNNVSLYTGVVLELDVFLWPSLVRQGASIGANATILCGITLGRYCFIGAGAVVTRDVPDYALVYGNPARVQGWMCQCGIRLGFTPDGDHETWVCGQCGSRYTKRGQVVQRGGEAA